MPSNDENFLPPIIVALDVSTYAEATKFISKLDPKFCQVKVGMELFCSCGPRIIQYLHKSGFKVFLDLKWKDIPETVARTALVACKQGVWMANMHADGTSKMMKAVVEKTKDYKTIFLGVTVLTSMDDEDLNEVGIKRTPIKQVKKLAKLTDKSGLHGVVCSGLEVCTVKDNTREGFITVVPGIRDPNSGEDDQSRVVTVEKAILAGADYVVIGRPIRDAENPSLALENFYNRAVKTLGV